jgi:hypothetical protein
MTARQVEGDFRMDRRFEKAAEVRVVTPYVIEVTFTDGTRRQVDIEPLFWGEVFAPLRDPALFAQAAVDPVGGSVYWPTGADLAPEFLYYGHDTPYGRIEIEAPEEATTGDKR